MAHLSQQYRITGVVPLIMHNGQTRNPLNDFSKEIKRISGKKSKTDADYEEMARVEWYASLYVQDGHLVMPGENWERLLLDAGRKRKLGKQIQAGTFSPGAYPIEYDGPQAVDDLWEDPRFRFTHAVKVGQSAVMRTRARFDAWACTIEVRYDPEIIDLSQLNQIMVIGGDMIGAGDWRPKFGRFQAQPVTSD